MNYRNFLIITKKELMSYFISPIAYIVIAGFLALIGVLFFTTFFLNKQAELRGFFSFLPWLYAVFIPAITMKLFAEEKNTGSFELLTTLPIKSIEIVIGKILASTILIALMLFPTITYVITVVSLGNVDLGPIFAGYFGAVVLAAAFSAIGVFASSLTKNQIVSLIIGLSICFFFILADKFAGFLPNILNDFMRYISADFHFKNIARGILDTRDFIFFISLISISVLTTTKIIEERR